MTDNAAMWAEIEANELRLFVGAIHTGLWCPTCHLPSGWKAPVQRDPTEPPGAWFTGCSENESHRVIEDER